jgi:hypothetical protein
MAICNFVLNWQQCWGNIHSKKGDDDLRNFI